MKIKKEYIILAVLILGLSLYIILRNPNKTHFELPNLPQIARADISKIELTKKGNSIVVYKKDNTWYIDPQGYKVSEFHSKNMLDAIQALDITAMVSESKNYTLYDLVGDNKITVKVWTGGDTPVLVFDVGKITNNYRHTFVKLADDFRVYHARSNLRNRFDLTLDNLRDKTVLSFNPAEIKQVRITQGEQTAVLSPKQVAVEAEGGKETPVQTGEEPEGQPEGQAEDQTEVVTETRIVWESADGKRADDAKFNNMLSTLANLRCQEYIDDKKKEDFTDPIYTVHLKGAEEYSLAIFAKEDEKTLKQPSISSESEQPFMLPEWQIKKVAVNLDELLGS
jgi:hypothetical protein